MDIFQCGIAIGRRHLWRRIGFVWVLGLGAFVVAGCDEPNPVVYDAVSDDIDATMDIVTAESLQTRIDLHQGKVVLVDFWATWCQPCVKAFPENVALQEKYGDQGLVIITVCMNDSEMYQDARKFLDEVGADKLLNVAAADGASQASMIDFDIPNAVPWIRLYDRGGRLVETFSVDHSKIEERITELLAQPDPTDLTPEEKAQLDRLLEPELTGEATEATPPADE